MKTSTLKKLILISIILIASLLFTISSYAADTDVIKNYEINISPRKNGTLLLTYTIDWKVLDSSSVGPLTDLYVGIPNKNVTDAELKEAMSLIDLGYVFDEDGTIYRDQYCLDKHREYLMENGGIAPKKAID